jgi:hypothetical protein
MTNMILKRACTGTLLLALMATMTLVQPEATAKGGQRGTVTGRSVGAGLLSFFIWPGIGQAVNNNPGDKVATHAVLGLVPPFRIMSGYDAWVDRSGGYWKGRI